MKEYISIELENNNKYTIIETLETKEKKYFLLSQVSYDETDIDSNFDICIYNEINNNFEPIEDEFEYETIKSTFEKKLEEQRKNLEEPSNIDIPNMIKLKITNIDQYNYTLQKTNGETRTKNIEIYGNFKIKINDYIYMTETTLKEINFLQYGPVINNQDEIIKIVSDNEIHYLQRYYG